MTSTTFNTCLARVNYRPSFMVSIFFILLLYFPFLKRYIESASAAQFLINSLFALLSLIIIVIYKPRLSKNIRIINAFLIAWATVILIISAATDSSPGRLLSDFGRPLLSIVYLMAGYTISNRALYSEKNLVFAIIKYSVLGCIFSLFVYFDQISWIVDLYKGRLSDDDLEFHYLRASGFSGYPTDFGVLLCLSSLLVFYSYKVKWISLRLCIFLIIIFFIGIYLSAARGALIQLLGLILLVSVGWVMSGFNNSLMTALMRAITISLSCIFVLMVTCFVLNTGIINNERNQRNQLDNISYMSVSIDDPDDSVLHRFSEIKFSAWQLFDDPYSLPTSSQREKPHGLGVVESFWGHHIMRYGWIGFLFACSWALLIIKVVNKNSVISNTVFYWLASFFLFVAPFSDVMSRLRGLPFYTILVGFVIGIGTYIKNDYRASLASMDTPVKRIVDF